MDLRELRLIQTRRALLKNSAAGVGMMALGRLLERDGMAQNVAPPDDPLAPKPPQFPAKAKSVIFLYMEGGPSQIDLFDPKPEMVKWDGQSLPESVTKDLLLAFIKPTAKVWASPRTFKQYGQSGIEFSDLMPAISTCADDLCMIRSMYTDQFNHHPGQLMLSSGTRLVGRPSMGAWVTYGLGSESQSLPGFVVLRSGTNAPGAGSGNWSNGFLASTYQGVPLRNSGDPILYLSNPPGVNQELQRSALDAIRDLNDMKRVESGDMQIASRIASYELAFRMQAAGPELMDLSKESPATLENYGINNPVTRQFGMNCLLARRMVERGVRFVQLMHGSWDDHLLLLPQMQKNCEIIDQPTAALLKDLKQRGLLDSTLVVWGGEFGRTPMVQSQIPDKNGAGRDHHPFAFSLWMAGGGVKGGQVVGKTDEFGLSITEGKIHVHDLHATMLHCLGIDHKRLTYRYMGRDFRLTDVEGEVIHKLLA